MHCVVMTIAESRKMDCNTDTALYGPFESERGANEQVEYLRQAYGRRVLYLRAFDLSSRGPTASHAH